MTARAPSKPLELVRRDFVIGSAGIATYEQCPGLGVYALEGGDDEFKPWLWWGIFLHRFLEYAKTRGRQAALDYVRPKLGGRLNRVCAAIDVEQIPDGATEVPLAHNPFDDSGRVLPKGRWGTAGMDWRIEQYGRADVLAERRGLPMVIDYKSGKGPHGNPAESTQLLGLAAAARRVKGTDGAYVALVGVEGNGDLHWRIARLDRGDLDSFATRARLIHERIIDDRERADRGIEPDFVKSPLCEGCDARPVCPAHR